MKTVKQIYATGTGAEQHEANTLMFNVQTMGRIAGLIYTDGTVFNMTIDELREAQDKLIPLYNEAIKNK
jgi:hypothetical protein